MVRILTVVTMAFALAGAAHAQQPKIGVFLPLTGPLSMQGTMALQGLAKLGKPSSDFILVDTASDVRRSAEAVQAMVQRDKVEIIIGGVTSAEIAAVLKVNQGVPVITLAPAASPQLAKAANASQITTFSQPQNQLKIVSNALPKGKKYLVGSTPGYAAKGDLFASSLPGGVIGRNAALSPQAFGEFSGLTKAASEQSAIVVGVMDDESAKRLMEALRADRGQGVVITPPEVERLAAIAANLVLEWKKKPNQSVKSWSDSVTRSPLYSKDLGSLVVAWNVQARGLGIAQSTSSTGGTPCKCTSKDGEVVKAITCNDPPEKCKTEQKQDDCTCKCS